MDTGIALKILNDNLTLCVVLILSIMMNSRTTLRLAAILLLLVLASCSPESEETMNAIPYPLDTCLVTDEAIGEDPDMEAYTFVHGGREIVLCCKGCLKSFNQEPEKYLAKLQPPAKPASND